MGINYSFYGSARDVSGEVNRSPCRRLKKCTAEVLALLLRRA